MLLFNSIKDAVLPLPYQIHNINPWFSSRGPFFSFKDHHLLNGPKALCGWADQEKKKKSSLDSRKLCPWQWLQFTMVFPRSYAPQKPPELEKKNRLFLVPVLKYKLERVLNSEQKDRFFILIRYFLTRTHKSIDINSYLSFKERSATSFHLSIFLYTIN